VCTRGGIAPGRNEDVHKRLVRLIDRHIHALIVAKCRVDERQRALDLGPSDKELHFP